MAGIFHKSNEHRYLADDETFVNPQGITVIRKAVIAVADQFNYTSAKQVDGFVHAVNPAGIQLVHIVSGEFAARNESLKKQ